MLTIEELFEIENYGDKYIVIGEGTLAEVALEMCLGKDYAVYDYLPLSGFLTNKVVVKNDDILSEDFNELKRRYKFAIQVEKRDGRRKIFKTAPEDRIIDATLESNKKLVIEKIVQKLEVKERHARRLVKFNDDDVNSLYNQIQQLSFLDPEEREEYIERLVIIEDDVIFDFLNELFLGYGYMEELEKLEDHPLKLIYMIRQQVRGMIICKDLKAERVRTISEKYDYHPYQVKIFKELAQQHTMGHLIDIFKLCSEKQREIKTGQIEPNIALDYICLFVAGG